MKASFVDLGFAQVDVGRLSRRGIPEVVFAEGKNPQEITEIMQVLIEHNGAALATRATQEQFDVVKTFLSNVRYENNARCIVAEPKPLPRIQGKIGVVSAGNTDLLVAEEARVTLEFLGNSVATVYDAGVAGLDRILAVKEFLSTCRVIIVVAGLDGALSSVVAGLVDKPVIAVPTSVGYGASFGGVAALLAMLNSCSNGLTVVNIDNGFGAACAATLINRILE
jgi:pyridinium-3,5-biscarboxylic acid mononucleotide synthase